jgi:hypothetical protein
MKYLLVLLIGFIFYSCSAPKLYQQGKRKIEKAVAKDPSLKQPAVVITKTDTLIQIDTVNNTITKTVTKTEVRDTCNFDNDDRQLTRWELRHQRKVYDDSLKHERKMFRLELKSKNDSIDALHRSYRLETDRIANQHKAELKKVRAENRCSPFLRFIGRMWWIFIIAGIALGAYIRKFLPF